MPGRDQGANLPWNEAISLGPEGSSSSSSSLAARLLRRPLRLPAGLQQRSHLTPQQLLANASPLRNLYQTVRFGKRQDPGSLGLDPVALNGGEFEDLDQLQTTVKSWEDKLINFAEKFSDDPGILEANPYWKKLLRVRDNLRLMLAKKRLNALNRTRM